jgi:glycosyltransferase involved in cell wall biosynthesis
LKILHVGMGWFGEEIGGLSRVVSQAVRAQADAGHDARALVTGTDSVQQLSGGLAKAFSPSDAFIPLRLLRARRAVARALRDMVPDVVSFHFALYGRPSLDLVRHRVPWVVHFHGPWAMEGLAEGASHLGNSLKKRFVEEPMYRDAPRVITLSRSFAEILVEHYGVRPDRIRVVPGGFDPGQFLAAPDRATARLRFHFPPDRRLAVCVRRLQSRMGLENLLEAVSILRAKHPDLLVAVAGRGPLAPILRERVEKDGLGDHVLLMGFVADTDLPAFYAAADFSIVPTVALEGFGLIVAESLASGTPVVASRVGALPELLSDFSPQLLAEPTAKGLAEVLDGVLSGNRPLPDAVACRDHMERWSWSRVVPRLQEVYREAGAK